MKDKIAHIQKASALCQPLFVKFERFIHIGQISSFLLLNLIEDILDMAKFKANMFKLIMSEFKLSSLLTEIDFLFCFQWIERNLKFKIVWDPDLANTTFVSDSKRISQVLINLISNSVKFTEKRLHHGHSIKVGTWWWNIHRVYSQRHRYWNQPEWHPKVI